MLDALSKFQIETELEILVMNLYHLIYVTDQLFTQPYRRPPEPDGVRYSIGTGWVSTN